MNTAWRWAGVAGVGAGLMYFLDPGRGRRRRAAVRDRAAGIAHTTSRAAGKTWRDLSHRAQGVAAVTGRLVRRGKEDRSDQVLEARIRTKLGRASSHPGAINVTVRKGRVRLDGSILDREFKRVMSAVWGVKGVEQVEEHLERHKTTGGAPALQGGSGRAGERFELAQRNWTPAIRAAVGIAGAGLLGYALKERKWPWAFAGLAGAAMLTRATTNREMKRILGAGRRRGIDFQKTIHIVAPVAEVFRYWSKYENFPKFMRNVRELRDLGNGRSHWVAAGPAGVPVSWDAEITERIENRVLAWKSTPGSMIENAGIVRFVPDRESTRVTIRLSYNPPAGQLGHIVASLFGADPKREIDEDLARLKSLIEEGKTSVRGETIGREQI